MFPAVPDPPRNDIPIVVAMARLEFGDEAEDEGEPPRNAQQRDVRRRRNPFPRNPPAGGAAQAVRNYERGRGGRRHGQAGDDGNRQDLEQRQQAELQRFLAMAERDEEQDWDSDELGDDDDDFVIPRR